MVDDGGRAEFAAERRGDVPACNAVIDPETSDPGVRMGQGEIVRGHRMKNTWG